MQRTNPTRQRGLGKKRNPGRPRAGAWERDKRAKTPRKILPSRNSHSRHKLQQTGKLGFNKRRISVIIRLSVEHRLRRAWNAHRNLRTLPQPGFEGPNPSQQSRSPLVHRVPVGVQRLKARDKALGNATSARLVPGFLLGTASSRSSVQIAPCRPKMSETFRRHLSHGMIGAFVNVVVRLLQNGGCANLRQIFHHKGTKTPRKPREIRR